MRPHKAVICISIEVHDVLPTGECSGKPISSKELEKNNIKSDYLEYIDGSSLEQCLEKLKKWIETKKEK